MSEANKALIRMLEDALNRHDLDAVASLHADVVLHQGFEASRDDFMRIWVDILHTFPDHHTTIDRLFATDDWVIELMHITGTHLARATTPHHGDLRGVEPTGKTFSVKQSHYWRIRNGQIIEHEVVRDDLGLHKQLGLAPPRPSSS